VSAQVQGQHVIIYDDMIRTGSSLLNAAEAYRKSGAKKISVVAEPLKEEYGYDSHSAREALNYVTTLLAQE